MRLKVYVVFFLIFPKTNILLIEIQNNQDIVDYAFSHLIIMDIFLPLGHIVHHCEARREEIKGKLIEFYDGRSSRQLQLICIFGGGSNTILSDTKSDIPSCLRTTQCVAKHPIFGRPKRRIQPFY